MKLEIYLGDCLEITSTFESGSFDLIYIDPPFNTGKVQSRKRLKTVRDDEGDRTGFQGKRYKTQVIGESSFDDSFDDFTTFLEPRLREAHRLLSPQGSFFFHIDYRESHYCKVMLDNIFGRDVLQERNRLGIRLRRKVKETLVRKARQHILVRQGPRQLYLSLRRYRPHPIHGTRTSGTGESGEGEDTDRCMVANNRESERQGEDGIPDAEANSYLEPHSSRSLKPR